jgi:hypothetical protein
VVVARRGTTSPPHHRASKQSRIAFSGEFPALFSSTLHFFCCSGLGLCAVVVAVRRRCSKGGVFSGAISDRRAEVVWMTGVVVAAGLLKLGFVRRICPFPFVVVGFVGSEFLSAGHFLCSFWLLAAGVRFMFLVFILCVVFPFPYYVLLCAVFRSFFRRSFYGSGGSVVAGFSSWW